MTDPDRRLATQAAGGDRRALESLYERYNSRMLGFLVRILGRRALAEDVSQEVWIKVLQKVQTYRPQPGSFRSWLFRIASNAAVDRMRREALRSGPELDAPTEHEGLRRIDLQPSPVPGPDRRGLGQLLGRAMCRALSDLPRRQASAVLLRHQQGLTYAEIATALGVPEGTAKTLVHRAVLALRGALKEWVE
jgi:RNA polymerase sigma-70 factor (ECF subfamily)